MGFSKIKSKPYIYLFSLCYFALFYGIAMLLSSYIGISVHEIMFFEGLIVVLVCLLMNTGIGFTGVSTVTFKQSVGPEGVKDVAEPQEPNNPTLSNDEIVEEDRNWSMILVLIAGVICILVGML